MRKGIGRSVLPSEVQEAVAKGKEYTYKIKLPDKTEFSVPIWDTGTQEAFLIHVQQAKSACKRKGLFQDYEDAIEAESKAVEQVKSLRKAIANTIGPKSKKDANDTNQSPLEESKASLKDALLEKKKAQEAFLIHVQQAKSACKRKGLFQDYDDAIEAETKSWNKPSASRRPLQMR